MKVSITEQGLQVHVNLLGLSPNSFDFSFEHNNYKKDWNKEDDIELNVEIARQKPKLMFSTLDNNMVRGNIDKIFFEIYKKKKVN